MAKISVYLGHNHFANDMRLALRTDIQIQRCRVSASGVLPWPESECSDEASVPTTNGAVMATATTSLLVYMSMSGNITSYVCIYEYTKHIRLHTPERTKKKQKNSICVCARMTRVLSYAKQITRDHNGNVERNYEGEINYTT